MKHSKSLGLVIALIAITAMIVVIENPFAESPLSKQTRTSTVPIGTEVGSQAPNFKLRSLNGGEFSLSDYRGKVTVVNFWATWCPFCVAEIPSFEKLSKELGDRIVILGVNRAESIDKQAEFLSKELPVKITYRLLIDPSDSVAQAYGVIAMPTTFFLNSEGVIVKKKLGELTFNEIKQVVSEILEPRPTQLSSTVQTGEEVKIQVTNGVKHIVPLNKILSGGPPKDGIPSIDKPKFVSAQEAENFLRHDDLVLGLFVDGVTKAYPRMILVWHEIVNDKINGKPVVVTYCPLCYTGAAFVRTLNGEEVEFGVSGKLYNSDLVMYDRKTDSYWSQILGQAIVGELAGAKLDRVPIDTLEWGAWKKLHPNTLVLSPDTGFRRTYGQDPYGDYYSSRSVFFPIDNEDSRLHPKAVVYGVESIGAAKAYPDSELAKVIIVNDVVGGTPLLATRDPDSKVVRVLERKIADRVLEFELRNGKLFDKQTGSGWTFNGSAVSGTLSGTQLNLVVASPHFWFAWAAFKPGTELFRTQ